MDIFHDMSRHMIERTTIRLPAVLMDIIRRKAVARGTTVTAIIEESLQRTAGEPDVSPKAEIKFPRTFKGGFGELPGVDPTHMADIYEMEDLEYIRRLHKGFE
jgi:hypothetical protein